MQIALLNVSARRMSSLILQVNLRSGLGRRALRHEPLGVDLDGRVYYVLSPRVIEDDGRPPFGWASGLLVWGVGVLRKADSSDADELAVIVPRWSHFGKSTDVKLLVKWIEWRVKKAVQATRPAKSPAKSKLNGSTTNAKITPKAISSANQSKLNLEPMLKASPMSAASPRPAPMLEVVIPISARKAASSGSSTLSDINGKAIDGSRAQTTTMDDDDGSCTSALTENSEEARDELLALLNPPGYKPSPETIDEEGKELARKLMDAAEWLEVLEWKGMGEV
jgi:hypothetical protein